MGFYRWLDSDYPPYMTNVIDVWNGAQWVNLWTQPDDGTEITDNPNAFSPGSGWTFIQHDVTAYKNPAMKIRFGFKIEDDIGVYNIGSWNINDVLVASAACP